MELNGARIRKARWNPGGRTLELLLRAASEQGDTDLLIRYRNVTRLEPALPQLAALVEDVALRVTEASLAQVGGNWVHRVRLGDAGELVITTGVVEQTETVAPGPDYADAGYRFELLSC